LVLCVSLLTLVALYLDRAPSERTFETDDVSRLRVVPGAARGARESGDGVAVRVTRRY
jgi:hypothetical protein